MWNDGDSDSMGPHEDAQHVHVRVAGAADAACAGRLLFDFNTEFDAPTPSAQDLASRFHTMLERQDVLVLLAEDSSADNPRAVGFAYLTLRPTPYGDGPVAELEELYVRPELRNHGIGSRLLLEALEQMRRRCALEMRIGVDEVDSEARRFYERHGFSNVEPDGGSRMLCYVTELVEPVGPSAADSFRRQHATLKEDMMKDVGVDELRGRLEAEEDLVVLDVREPDEVAQAAISGSVNIPLGQVIDRMSELDPARPTVVICAGGVRSAKAIEALTAAGYTGELVNVTGGMKAWLSQ
jgi:Rhodanese-related sulfurtransferase